MTIVMVKEVVILKLTVTETIILEIMVVLVGYGDSSYDHSEGDCDGGRDVELPSR